MKRYTVAVFMLLAMHCLQAQIYKWTDSDGIVHFSDIPHVGATTIKLPEVKKNNSSVNPLLDKEPVASSVTTNSTANYRDIAITAPKNDATIRNNQGYVPVIVSIEPELKPGDLIQILFDGEPLGKPKASMISAINDIKRGTHTIAASVVDKDGGVIKTSEAVTIYMHRPMVGMVPNTKPVKSGP